MDDLAGHVRAVFGLDSTAPATLTPGGRGASGRILRLEIGSRRYAVKELFDDEPPVEALIVAEVEFTRRAATAGVRVAASYPATDGRYAAPMPAGTGWLRLFDWLDARAVDLEADDVPARLGTLLGMLHLCAPRSDREPGGEPPDDWFDVPPAVEVWVALAERALAAGATWAPDLVARIALIEAITALATPADHAAMITCHRDLHPENVLIDGDGEFIVVDWDNLGPADPSRELGRVVLDWFYDNGVLAAAAVHAMLAAYRATGAPGRIADDDGSPTDVFGFVIASRLNFLERQIGIALDTEAPESHREWAVREIDEALRILPAPAVFAQLTEIDAALDRRPLPYA